MPYRSVRVSVLATNRLGFWKPLNIENLIVDRRKARPDQKLFRVKLDDELLVHLDLHQLAALRQAGNATPQSFPVHFDPVRRGRVRRSVASGQDGRIVLAAFADGDDVADLHLRGGNVALAAVDVDVTVADHLARLRAAGAEAHTVDDAVEAALQAGHQVLAGDAFGVCGLFVGAAELALENAVDAPDLLLFTKLETVADDFGLAVLSMLSGNEIAALDGALLAVAALALEEQFHALAPALPANGADVSCQVLFSLPF